MQIMNCSSCSIICPRNLVSSSTIFPFFDGNKIKSRLNNNNNNNNVVFLSSSNSFLFNKKKSNNEVVFGGKYDPLFSSRRRGSLKVVASSSSSSSVGNVDAPLWESWSPDNSSPSPSFSDILWPSLGAFVAMAMLGKADQMLATKGLSSITIAPLGAVCAVLFVTPKSPGARKYNMFMAQIGCAAIGVLAFSIFGQGWLARSAALAASIAFMIYTKSTHPPAASLPLLFIDGAKFHGLNFWYALFPGAAGCILIALLQEIVTYMQQNYKF